MALYDFKKIEKRWRKKWKEEGIYEPDPSNPSSPFYNLMMFPYPSAEGLHVGNMYAFTGSDIYGRFKRMQGYDVFEPIGLDGFGIHSENYALKTNQHPMKLAEKSEKNFYRQLRMLGNRFAWNETLETYDPEYYKWTQWILTEMFKRGLMYRKKAAVNWCPSCKTVLADEQVLQKSQVSSPKSQKNSKPQIPNSEQDKENIPYSKFHIPNSKVGACERCETPVVKKELEQWFLKITDYAERLLSDLEKIDWSEKVKIAQRNWIGKSEGAEIDFEIRTKEKPNFVLLHGYTGSPKHNFFPWLKKELEKRGYKVQSPTLPHSDASRANENDDMDAFRKQVELNRNTVLLGHSLGTIVAMKALEKLDYPIRKLALVGGFLEPRFRDHARSFTKTFNWRFNFEKIRTNAGKITILHDPNDRAIPYDQGVKLHDALGGELIEPIPKKSHFCGKEEPEILKYALDRLTVFTTRPDTIFGATYMVLAPEHPLVKNLESGILNLERVKDYIRKTKNKSEEERIADGREKTGVELKGIKAINPANGEEIPVWVADYVLNSVGTGAIMAVPAHDERDFEFAKKYKLPIIEVVEPLFVKTDDIDGVRPGLPLKERSAIVAVVKHWSEDKYLCLKWKKTDWRGFIIGGIEEDEDMAEAAAREIREETC